MTATVTQRVMSVASDIFGIPPSTLSAESGPENIQSWDSTQHLSFILALEEAFELQFSPEETETIKTVGDAIKLVEGKLPPAGG